MFDKILSEIVGFVKEFGGLCAAGCAAAGTAAFIVFASLAVFKRNFGGKSRGKFYAISAMLAAFTGALYGLNGIAAEFFFSCAFLYLFYSLVLFILPVRKSKNDKASAKKQKELARYIDEQVKRAGELAYAKRGAFGKGNAPDCEGIQSRAFCGGEDKNFSARNYREFPEEQGRRNGAQKPFEEARSCEPNAPCEYYEETSSPLGKGDSGFAREKDLPLAEIRAGEASFGGEKPCGERASEKYCNAAERKSGFNDEIDYSHVKNVIARLDYFGLKESDRRQIHDLEASLSEAERGVNSEELKGRINDGLSSLLKIMSKYGA